MSVRIRGKQTAAVVLLALLATMEAGHAGSTSSSQIGNNGQVIEPTHPVVPIGVRIYIDPWDPRHPAEDTFQTYYDQPEIISRIITDAWNKTRPEAAAELVAKLKERSIGGGFRTYNATVVLPAISTFSIKPSGHDGAKVTFTLPALSVTTSFRTPKLVPGSLDPRFQVTADLTIGIDFAFNTNRNFTAANVTVQISNVHGPLGLDPTAKALQIVIDAFNALSKFLIGIDFTDAVVAVLNEDDPIHKSLQPIINDNLKGLNQKLQAFPPGLNWTTHKVWADNNRLTLYVATPPLSVLTLATNGSMTGHVSWDRSQVTGACSDVGFGASVQTGPAPLERSDGKTFGPAPTSRLKTRTSFASQGPSLCSYTLSGLVPGVANALFATTKLAAVNAHGSSSTYVGQLHATTTIAAVGWPGDYVTPNAQDKNWVVSAGLTASGAVGKQVQKQTTGTPDPGAVQTPGVANSFGQFGSSAYQTGVQPTNLANASGATSINSYNANSAGYALPVGTYLFEYVDDKGKTKEFHAHVEAPSQGIVAIAWGKKKVSGPLSHNAFASTDLRSNGKPVLEGTLTGNGAMTGRYLAEDNGKLYAATFTLAKQ